MNDINEFSETNKNLFQKLFHNSSNLFNKSSIFENLYSKNLKFKKQKFSSLTYLINKTSKVMNFEDMANKTRIDESNNFPFLFKTRNLNKVKKNQIIIQNPYSNIARTNNINLRFDKILHDNSALVLSEVYSQLTNPSTLNAKNVCFEENPK